MKVVFLLMIFFSFISVSLEAKEGSPSSKNKNDFRRKLRYNWLKDKRDVYLKDRWPEPSIYQRLSILNYTVVKHKIFGSRGLNPVNLSNGAETASYQHWQYHYAFQANYRYYHWIVHIDTLHGRNRSFSSNGKELENGLVFQTAIRPEFHYRILFLSLGMGYRLHFGDATPIYSQLFNDNAPYFTLGIDQRIWILPIHLLATGSASLKGFRFDSDAIYSVSGGMRFEFTYYVYFTMLYRRTWQVANEIRDNIIDMSLDFRWTPNFSLHSRYTRLILTEGREPFNEISLGASYRFKIESKK